jgi:predicted nucleic acid-binding protein
LNKTMIYLDTSVIGGCFDAEFKVDSLHLIEQIINGVKIGVVSEITEKEIMNAPVEIKNHYAATNKFFINLKAIQR